MSKVDNYNWSLSYERTEPRGSTVFLFVEMLRLFLVVFLIIGISPIVWCG